MSIKRFCEIKGKLPGDRVFCPKTTPLLRDFSAVLTLSNLPLEENKVKYRLGIYRGPSMSGWANGQWILVSNIDDESATISMPMSQKQRNNEITHGSALITVNTTTDVPLHFIETTKQ
jgi:hypothetical protein